MTWRHLNGDLAVSREGGAPIPMVVSSALVGGMVWDALNHLRVNDGCAVLGCPSCTCLVRLAESGQLEQALAGWGSDHTNEAWWDRDRREVNREWLTARMSRKTSAETPMVGDEHDGGTIHHHHHRRFRAGWIAIQEDGTPVSLHGVEHVNFEDAAEECVEARSLSYVAESWVEYTSCGWTRWNGQF